MSLFDAALSAVVRAPIDALSFHSLAAAAPCLSHLVPRLLDAFTDPLPPHIWLDVVSFLAPHIPPCYRNHPCFSLLDDIPNNLNLNFNHNIAIFTLLNFSGLKAFDDKTLSSLRSVECTAAILKLSSTSVSDYGLHQLSLSTRRGAWKNLVYLALSRTNISDKSVPWLATFPSIKIIDLRSTNISTSGCVCLAKSAAVAFRMARSSDELAFFDPKLALDKLFDILSSETFPDRPFTITMKELTHPPPSTDTNTTQRKHILNAHAPGIGHVYSNTHISVTSLNDQAARDPFNDFAPLKDKKPLPHRKPVIASCPTEPSPWLLVRKHAPCSPTHSRRLNPPLAKENASTSGFLRKKTSRLGSSNALDDIIGPRKHRKMQ